MVKGSTFGCKAAYPQRRAIRPVQYDQYNTTKTTSPIHSFYKTKHILFTKPPVQYDQNHKYANLSRLLFESCRNLPQIWVRKPQSTPNASKKEVNIMTGLKYYNGFKNYAFLVILFHQHLLFKIVIHIFILNCCLDLFSV